MKRRSGCLQGILLIALVGVFVLGIQFAGNQLDRRRFPWGYETPGSPTLAGTWVGPVTSGSGQRLAMLIEMRLAPLDYKRRRSQFIRTRRSTWLIGRVVTCNGRMGPQVYELNGQPDGDNRNASRFRLSMYPENDTSAYEGLAPSHMQGRWPGKDSIDLLVSFHLRKNRSAISSTDDPDTGRDTPVTLERGTEADFNSLCGRLRG